MQLLRWITAGSLKRRWWAPISSYQHLKTWHRQFSTSAENSYLTTFWDPSMSKSTWTWRLLVHASTNGARTFRARLLDNSWCIWRESQLVTGPVRWPPDFYSIPDGRQKAYQVCAVFFRSCLLCAFRYLLGNGFWSSPKPARVAHSHKIQSKEFYLKS